MPRETLKKRFSKMYNKRYLLQKENTKNTIEHLEEVAENVYNMYGNDLPRARREKQIFTDVADILRTSIKFNADKEIRDHINSKRYLFRGKEDAPKIIEKHARIDFLMSLDDERFRSELRMDKKSFKKLHGLIKNHEVFQSSSSHPQDSVEIQMATVLERLGSYGNGSGYLKLSMKTGIGSK